MKKLLKPVTWAVPLLALASTAAYADHPITKPTVYQNKVETALIWVEPRATE